MTLRPRIASLVVLALRYVPLPSCGDGKLQGSEQCDDGANNGGPASTCGKGLA